MDVRKVVAERFFKIYLSKRGGWVIGRGGAGRGEGIILPIAEALWSFPFFLFFFLFYSRKNWRKKVSISRHLMVLPPFAVVIFTDDDLMRSMSSHITYIREWYFWSAS